MTQAQELINEEPQPETIQPAGHVRWMICALLCGAIIVIYIHRNIVSVLNSTFVNQFKWNASEADNYWGYLGMVFTGAYGIGMFFAGRILDRIGVRRTFLVAGLIWSAIATGHGLLGRIPFGSAFEALLFFVGFRIALGSVEGTFFPAAIRGVAEWFPKRKRAFATGIFNAGACIGAILSPWLVPKIYDTKWGWPMAFYLAGGLGFVWCILWMVLYREPEKHPMVSAAELDYIRSDRALPVAAVPWGRILIFHQTWAFAIGKFITDPIWWFYIFWLPGFLQRQYHLDIKHFGPPLIIIYVMSDVGSIVGGWLSSLFMRRGHSVNFSRKAAMLICAACVLPMAVVPWVRDLRTATLLIGLAAAAHQGWSANLFTLSSDMAPRSAVGSVVGFGGMCGAIGSMLFQLFVGKIVTRMHVFKVPLIVAAFAYLVSLVIIQKLAPHLEPMVLDEESR